MTVHIIFQNGFVERLVLYKTIENSNVNMNGKMLLSNVKIFSFARNQYNTVESEKKIFYIDNSLRDERFIYMKIFVKLHLFTFRPPNILTYSIADTTGK